MGPAPSARSGIACAILALLALSALPVAAAEGGVEDEAGVPVSPDEDGVEVVKCLIVLDDQTLEGIADECSPNGPGECESLPDAGDVARGWTLVGTVGAAKRTGMCEAVSGDVNAAVADSDEESARTDMSMRARRVQPNKGRKTAADMQRPAAGVNARARDGRGLAGRVPM